MAQIPRRDQKLAEFGIGSLVIPVTPAFVSLACNLRQWRSVQQLVMDLAKRERPEILKLVDDIDCGGQKFLLPLSDGVNQFAALDGDKLGSRFPLLIMASVKVIIAQASFTLQKFLA